jgi:transcriptional regulator with GAF, ATPase, and Fis domain
MPDARQPLTAERVQSALQEDKGNVTAAAKRLGVARQSLLEAMDRHGIEIRREVHRRQPSST